MLDVTQKIHEADLQGALTTALLSVNNGADYSVSVDEKKELKANQPIHLVLKQDGVTVPIGITHFAELTEDFDEVPFEKTARTIDQLTKSILKAVQIHNEAKTNRDVIITAAGTPFFKKGINIEIRDGILFIEGRQITFKGEPFLASRLCGEEGISFRRTAEGDFETVNPIDRRKGKGIFFNKNTGEIYRK